MNPNQKILHALDFNPFLKHNKSVLQTPLKLLSYKKIVSFDKNSVNITMLSWPYSAENQSNEWI